MNEPWMSREQCPRHREPYFSDRRELTFGEVMPAPLTWEEWCAARLASPSSTDPVSTGRAAVVVPLPARERVAS